MMRPRCWFALLLVIALFFHLSLLTAGEFHQVSVTFQPPLPGEMAHGYRELSFLVTNHSDRQKDVTLTINSTVYYSLRVGSLSRHIKVPPFTTLKVRLYQPPLALFAPEVALSVDGYYQQSIPGVTVKGMRMDYYNSNIRILITKGISLQLSSLLEKKDQWKRIKTEVSRTDLPGSEWSNNWLAYSRYDIIILAGQDWRQLAPSVRKALEDYVNLGGVIMFCGMSPPDGVKKRAAVQRRHCGLGLMFYSLKPQERLTKKDLAQLIKDGNTTRDIMSEKIKPRLSTAVKTFTIMKNIEVPVRSLLIIMTLFTFGFGPLILFILQRKNRRIHILWISPLAAVIFLVFIIIFALTGEGLYNRSRKNTLTLLDENQRRAATLGVVGFYCPIAPHAVNFSSVTELHDIFNSRYQDRACNIDWSGQQSLTGGWMSSRVPVIMYARKAEPRRERLEIFRNNGKLEVVNGLGAEITDLRLLDFDGSYYCYSGVIAPGAKAVLLPRGHDKTVIIRPEAMRNLFAGSWFRCADDLTPKSGAVIFPRTGCYLARLTHSPFISTGIADPGELKESSVVVGLMRKSAAGSMPSGKGGVQ